jgi:hypothetical protein
MPDTKQSLHPQLANYRQGFLDLKDDAQALTDGVSDAAMQTAPDEDSWSVVQIFDHVNTAGWLLLSEMERAIREGHDDGTYGEPPFTYGFISRWFVRSMKPSSGWTFSAPEPFQPDPTETLYPGESVREFLALQDDFAGCITTAEGLDLRSIRVPSPAVPLLRISLGAWFEATLAHQRRHLAQARDILQD